MSHSSLNSTDFDEYAADYDAALGQGLSVSREGKNYFARGRIAWLGNRLQQMQEQPRLGVVRALGKQSLEPRYPLCDEPRSI